MKRTTWKVYPCAPGPRDVAWRMKAVPPPGSRGLKVVYQEAKATSLEDVRAEGEAWEAVINRTLILERDPTVGAVIADPHGDQLGAWAQENPAAMWALLNDPARLVALRLAMVDALPELARAEPQTRRAREI